MNLATRVRGRRSAAALAATGGLLVTVGLAGLGPVGAQASSHREAPLISGMPQYDATDLYAFRSPERGNTVTLAASWLPFEEPAGGPNFYSFATDAHYDINVDNDGDALADIIYRWKFKDHYRSTKTFLYATGEVDSLGDKDLNYYQTYKLQRIKANGNKKTLIKSRKVVPSDVGAASMPDYQFLRTRGVTEVGEGKKRIRSFAGQAEDSFFLDLRVFDLLYGGDFGESGDDTLAGFNVNSVALQVPRYKLAKNKNTSKNPIIGTWTTTSRKGVNGKYQQVSRLGMPLVNEVVIPVGDKDTFNASQPKDDGQFLDYVTDPELARLIEGVYDIDAPETPRNDLVSVFLTGVEGVNQPKNVTPSEQLRLNMTTPVTESPDRLGVIGGDLQGYPNGRRLADDVIDISLQVVEGELVGNENDLSDGVDQNDVAFADDFPYLALPARGSDDAPHDQGALNRSGKNSGNDNNGAAAPTSGSSGLSSLAASALPSTSIALGLLALMAGVVGIARRPRQRLV